MSERNGVQADRPKDRFSVERATKKAKQMRSYLPLPHGFYELNADDQREVCRAMAEEIQRLLGVGPSTTR
jgi:hypothetical protein